MYSEEFVINAAVIENELNWFTEILSTAILLNCGKKAQYSHVAEINSPDLPDVGSVYADFIIQRSLNFHERFLLILALVPQIKPELLDVFMARNSNTNQIYTEFGGRIAQNHSGFLPTGETFMYILCGARLHERLALQQIFSDDHFFAHEKMIWLTEVEAGSSAMKGTIVVSQELLDFLTTGKKNKPAYNSHFPAKQLLTKMEWNDLVLPNATEAQLEDIQIWLKHQTTLMEEWEMDRKLKPGYRTLFYGPPGTGKSLTAALLGKRNEIDVYRIDLSKLVSKYIGETEKNLSNIFDRAEHKNWILFFDEADALFGKRTNVSDAHDRYANQEVSYLLQRIEDYNGLVILASNLKENIDEAFLRRFHSTVFFPVPKAPERALLWAKTFPEKAELDTKLEVNKIASDYELAGGSIVNIVQYSSLMALNRNSKTILLKDVLEGVRREFAKSGRTV